MSAVRQLWLAPLRGVTIRTFRTVFAGPIREAGFTGAYAPFIPALPAMRIRPATLADILPFDPALVPQAIGKDPAALTVLLEAFKKTGYRRADLNAGCPFPMIIHKGRGSGLLRTPEVLRAMLAAGVAAMGPGNFSVKVRLGVDDPRALARLMPLINEFPLAAVTIHARTAKQMYSGGVDLVRFGEALALSRNPVIYNGEISNCGDAARIVSRFPSVAGLMVGRGFVRSLGARPDAEALLAAYMAASEAELCGPAPVLGRMKELLAYWRDATPVWRRRWESVKLCRTLDELRSVVK